MEYQKLHTYTLEKLFGPLEGHIIKQDKNIRIIHLKDKNGISRTLGVVRFLNVENLALKDAHAKILEGGLMGKTLYNLEINFDKEFIGTLQVKLPEWLKKDFNTSQDNGLVLFSKILVDVSSTLNEKFIYSELIEIVPPELKDLFVDETKPLLKIDNNLWFLLKSADLTNIELIKKA